MNFDYVVTNVPGPGANDDDFVMEFAGCSCLAECSVASSCSCLLYGDNYGISFFRPFACNQICPS